MTKENGGNPAGIPISFFLIASVCIFMIVGTAAGALLPNTVQPAGNDRSTGISGCRQHTVNDGAAWNTLSGLTQRMLGPVQVAKSCINASLPPRNTADSDGKNYCDPPGEHSCMEEDTFFSECAYIDVQCIGYVYHNGVRFKGIVGKTRGYCWFYCSDPWQHCFEFNQYCYVVVCEKAYPNNQIISANSVGDCYT
jgi:hypothetical protein